MKLISHKKIKGMFMGNCSKCNYVFNIDCKKIEILSEDTTIICPQCGNKESLQMGKDNKIDQLVDEIRQLKEKNNCLSQTIKQTIETLKESLIE